MFRTPADYPTAREQRPAGPVRSGKRGSCRFGARGGLTLSPLRPQPLPRAPWPNPRPGPSDQGGHPRTDFTTRLVRLRPCTGPAIARSHESGHRKWVHPGDQDDCHDPKWNELINPVPMTLNHCRVPLPANTTPRAQLHSGARNPRRAIATRPWHHG